MKPIEKEAMAIKLDGLAETAKKLAAVLRGEQVDQTGRGLMAILLGKLKVFMDQCDNNCIVRIKKYNSSNGAILCNGCRVIVKEGFGDEPTQISKEDWQSNEPLFCKECDSDGIL